MTTTQFKEKLQLELKQESFGIKVSKVYDDTKLHTTIEFDQEVTPELFRWLNSRFLFGVSAFKNIVTLNPPKK